MIVVVDTNIIIAALVRNSKTRKALISGKIKFVSPDFVKEELQTHESSIVSKSGLSREEFSLILALLLEEIEIIPYKEYKDKIPVAKRIMSDDPKDVAYVACYRALGCDAVWTNDKDYYGKQGISTLDTKRILSLLNL